VEGRALKVRETYLSLAHWSPTPVPAVTRACLESRKYCNYPKAFIVDQSPRYIWVNFGSDVIQMYSMLMVELVKGNNIEKEAVRHLRIELEDVLGHDQLELFYYYHNHSHTVCYLPGLDSYDALVNDELAHSWTTFIEERCW
jgi:hypothetical protein